MMRMKRHPPNATSSPAREIPETSFISGAATSLQQAASQLEKQRGPVTLNKFGKTLKKQAAGATASESEWTPKSSSPSSTLLTLSHDKIFVDSGGQLHLVALQTPQAILDLGTGTGIWAMEIADPAAPREVRAGDGAEGCNPQKNQAVKGGVDNGVTGVRLLASKLYT
ncbi:hypothetical protein V8E54_012522 [Elaphomyces granulatus]